MFEKEDIGKKVLLELNPEKIEIAIRIGVSRVTSIGTILEVEEDYVKIFTEPSGLPELNPKSGSIIPCIVQRKGKEKEIPYSLIKSYELL